MLFAVGGCNHYSGHVYSFGHFASGVVGEVPFGLGYGVRAIHNCRCQVLHQMAHHVVYVYLDVFYLFGLVVFQAEYRFGCCRVGVGVEVAYMYSSVVVHVEYYACRCREVLYVPSFQR